VLCEKAMAKPWQRRICEDRNTCCLKNVLPMQEQYLLPLPLLPVLLFCAAAAAFPHLATSTSTAAELLLLLLLLLLFCAHAHVEAHRINDACSLTPTISSKSSSTVSVNLARDLFHAVQLSDGPHPAPAPTLPYPPLSPPRL
jgi:hypothetical protein